MLQTVIGRRAGRTRRSEEISHARRKPKGPALVQHLEGSERAKQRLEVILETIAGELTIEQACECLGIPINSGLSLACGRMALSAERAQHIEHVRQLAEITGQHPRDLEHR